MFDLIIKNGRVVDGSGNPWYRADVGIRNGKVEALGPLNDAQAARVIDAKQRIVSPGFIDIHTHSDLTFLIDPEAQSKLRQGVTTEVVGNCGGSWGAPLRGEALEASLSYGRRYGGIELDELNMQQYLDRLDDLRPPVNIVAQVGHGTVRACVLGYEDRDPTPDELEQMQKLVAESMQAGALGMSTGLYYAPGSYARLDEVVALARVVKQYNGFVSSHIRDESTYNIGLLAALDEALEVGRQTGVRVEIAHLKALGPAVWGSAPRLLELFETARASGLDAGADQYPYPASGSSITGALVPRWAQADGRSVMVKRLADPTYRQRVRAGIVENYERRGGAARLTVASFEPVPEYEGRTMAELAEVTGKHPADLAIDMLVQADASFVSHVIDEDDMYTIAAHPFVAVGSDGSSLSASGPLSVGQPHPRHFGTFPRVLAHFVRERGVLRLETAVRKMTSLSAQKIGLRNRGLLREGAAADVVVFDPDRVCDRATFADPKQYPDGIDYVVVNGVVSVEEQDYTGARGGRTLRSWSD